MSNNRKVESSAHSPPIRELFFAAQLEAVIRESRSGVLILLAISVIAGLWFLGETSLRAVYVWIIYMVIVCLAAYLVLTQMLRDPEKELKARRWANGMTLGSLLIGAGWGALGVLFFPHDNASLLSFLLLATVVLTALAASILSPVVSVFWAFLLAAVLPLCVQIFIMLGYSHFQSGLTLSCFLLIMGLIADRNEKKERIHVREKVILRKEVQSRRLLEKAFLGEKEKANSAISSRRDFMSNVSLELRTHLNSIIGFSGILSKNASGSLAKDDVTRAEKINSNGLQLLIVINNLLDFSRMEANQLEVEVNLRNIIEESVVLQRDAAEEKGLNLSYHVVDDVPKSIRTDPAHLWQILNNLIGNAIKFTEKGAIEVEVASQVGADGVVCLKFSVKDSGIGIDEKVRPRIFLPFAQGKSGSDEKPGGMGLGLAISQYLIRRMGGDIDVWSRVGEGSVFTFTIQCGEVAQNASIAR